MEKRSGRDLTYEILNFVENNGMITVKQASKIFYKSNSCGELQANQKLSTMYKRKALKRECVFPSKAYVYYLDKHPSYHQVLLLDVYAELIYQGCEIISFKKTPTYYINGKKMIPDGLFIYNYQDIKYGLFVEIDYTHSPSNQRYIDLYNTNKVQEQSGGFPNVLRVSQKNEEDIIGDNFDIMYVHHDLIGFEKVL